MNFQNLENTLTSLLETHSVEEVLDVLHIYASDRVRITESLQSTSADSKWQRCVQVLDRACDELSDELSDSYYLVY